MIDLRIRREKFRKLVAGDKDSLISKAKEMAL